MRCFSWSVPLFVVLGALSIPTTAGASFHLEPAQPAVHTGGGLPIHLRSDQAPPVTLSWTATAGVISGTGLQAVFVAGNTPGWVVVTAAGRDNAGNYFSCRTAVFVYRHLAIIKADDLTYLKSQWSRFTDIMDARRLPRSIGIIANSLEPDGVANQATLDWIETQRETGLSEFFCHGYNHSSPPVDLDGTPVQGQAEFGGTSFEFQRSHLDRAQQLAQEVLGFQFETFAAPQNSIDANTALAIDAVANFKVWLFGRNDSSALNLDRTACAIFPEYWANGQAFLDYASFTSAYQTNPQRDTIVVQVHPASWDVWGNNFTIFEQILDFLIQQGATFVKPIDAYDLTEEGIVPLDGTMDSDGDGMPDADEGALDPDADGLPNLLDTDSDNDTIPDTQERDAGTDPYAPQDSDSDGISDVSEGGADVDGDGLPNSMDTDSDGDSLPDSEEHTDDCLNPYDSDTDDDLVGDGSELSIFATDPCRPDCDLDGLLDGQEVLQYYSSPWLADSDADGLLDGQEVLTGSCPTDSDSDGAGINDGVEYSHGMQPLYPGDDNVLDVDFSGSINAVDVQVVIMECLGMELGLNSDITRDGKTDAVDVQTVIGAALSLPGVEGVNPYIAFISGGTCYQFVSGVPQDAIAELSQRHDLSPGPYQVSTGEIVLLIEVAPNAPKNSFACLLQLFSFVTNRTRHSHADDGLTYQQLNYKLFVQGGTLALTCGTGSNYFNFLVRTTMNVLYADTRPAWMFSNEIFAAARSDASTFGHTVLEIRCPEIHKWVIFDLDKGVIPFDLAGTPGCVYDMISQPQFELMQVRNVPDTEAQVYRNYYLSARNCCGPRSGSTVRLYISPYNCPVPLSAETKLSNAMLSLALSYGSSWNFIYVFDWRDLLPWYMP